MTTLTIHVPDSKADFIKQLLKELDVKIEIKKANKKTNRTPNAETIKAMKELKTGKGKVFDTAKDLFASL
ncbi:hypothetical protein D3C87_842180 [compost metagenome]